MSWTLYGERLLSTDFSAAPRVYQPFTMPRTTKVKAIRTWFVIYNNPTFTALTMRIYANSGGVPTDLLHTFDNSWALADLLLVDHYGAKEVYFEFDNPLWLKGGDTYHLVPWVTGNSFTSASHLSWVKGFPDPNTVISPTLALKNIASLPHYLAVIGAEI